MENSISTAGQVRGGAQRNNDDDSMGPALVTSKKPSSVISGLVACSIRRPGGGVGSFHICFKCAADGQVCQHRLGKPTATAAEGGRLRAGG